MIKPSEPTARDLYAIDRLIEAAHQAAAKDKQASSGFLQSPNLGRGAHNAAGPHVEQLDITWEEDETGERCTYDYDEVMRLLWLMQSISNSNVELQRQIVGAHEEAEDWHKTVEHRGRIIAGLVLLAIIELAVILGGLL